MFLLYINNRDSLFDIKDHKEYRYATLQKPYVATIPN